MTPEEKEASIVESRQKIINLATTKEAMLQTMGCDKPKTALQKCLKMYPALLRDGYCRQSIKDKKKLMTLNAKSGVLHCKNRRVYAIPDMYAACEYWFQHIEKPEGLLKDGEVYCMLNKDGQRLDILRNPSLYMEHAVRTNKISPEIKKWFKTGGVYTSCHDLISRILQFDKPKG